MCRRIRGALSCTAQSWDFAFMHKHCNTVSHSDSLPSKWITVTVSTCSLLYMHSVFICITTAALHSPFNWPFGSCVGFCVLMFSFYYKPHSPGDMVSNVAQLRHLLEQALHRPHSQCSLCFFYSVCFVGNHNEWVIYNTKKSPAFQVWWLHYNQSSSFLVP